MDAKQYVAGGLLILFSGISLIINISVLVVLIQHFTKHNSIYVFVISNILGNSVQVFLIFLYLGPMSMLQTNFLPHIGNKLLSFVFLSLWYTDMTVQLVMALNRFLTVVYHKERLFTRKRCWLISIVIYSTGFVMAFFSDYVIPCCTAYIDYKVYSYTYIDTGINYVNMYVDMPINVTSSFMCSILYIALFIYVRKVNQSNIGISYAESNARRRKEVRYAVQFATCSIFACVAWILFRVLPVIIPAESPYLRSLIVHFLTGHCTANALVFVLFNGEFKAKYFRKKGTNVSHMAVSYTVQKTQNRQN